MGLRSLGNPWRQVKRNLSRRSESFGWVALTFADVILPTSPCRPSRGSTPVIPAKAGIYRPSSSICASWVERRLLTHFV